MLYAVQTSKIKHNPSSEGERTVADRREKSAWSSPATWFGMAGLVISFAGLCVTFITGIASATIFIVGTWVASQVQTAKIEVVNSNLINRTNELGGQVAGIQESLQSAEKANISVTKDQQAQANEIAQLRAFQATQVIVNGDIDKKLVELKAQVSNIDQRKE